MLIKQNKRKKLIIICSIIACFALIFFITFYFLNAHLNKFSSQSIYLNEDNQYFILDKGTSVTKFTELALEQKIINNALMLKLYLKLNPRYQSIKSGAYLLTNGMSIEEFLKQITEGKEAQFAIKLIEGKTVHDFLKVIADSKHLEHKLKNLTQEQIKNQLQLDFALEGWFYPDTYFYTKNMTDIDILKRAHFKMKQTLEQIWQTRDNDLPYDSAYELLKMASIIEKETSIDDERAKIASVFVNRLKLKMKLQTDPTIIYGLGPNFKSRLVKSHLTDKNNLYNTYVYSGLPPTPITIPSLASLKAAAKPEKTDYLFFVADKEGKHKFTTNYKDHKKAVDDYWNSK